MSIARKLQPLGKRPLRVDATPRRSRLDAAQLAGCGHSSGRMNQSEVVRVGLRVLANLKDEDLKVSAEKLERLGRRPSKSAQVTCRPSGMGRLTARALEVHLPEQDSLAA